MIVRMHMQDATVDLAPAKKLLEEGLGIGEAREDCRRALASNLEYVKQYLRPPGDPGL
jgi:DNA-directed RNA polymerase subunit F